MRNLFLGLTLLLVVAPAAEACNNGCNNGVVTSAFGFQSQAFIGVPTNAFLVQQSPFFVGSAFGSGANVNIVESRRLFGGRRDRVIQANAGGGNANINIVERRRRLFGR